MQSLDIKVWLFEQNSEFEISKILISNVIVHFTIGSDLYWIQNCFKHLLRIGLVQFSWKVGSINDIYTNLIVFDVIKEKVV